MEKDDRAGWAFRRNHPVFLNQSVYRLVGIGTADRVFGESPVFRNAIKVLVGREHPEFVLPGNKHSRPVEFCHVVQKQGGIYDMRFRHAVVLEPSTIILVPVPYLTVMGILGVDFELM